MTLQITAMQIGKRCFEWGDRTYVMGVLNVTPDSFSGDGLLSSDAAGSWVERCVDQALRMEAAGADIHRRWRRIYSSTIAVRGSKTGR